MTQNTNNIIDELHEIILAASVRGLPNAFTKLITNAVKEIERLKMKCDDQAKILRQLTPDKFPDTIFITGYIGNKDQNGMPEKLMLVPSYGSDVTYIYTKTEE
jgi:hypothetical protein